MSSAKKHRKSRRSWIGPRFFNFAYSIGAAIVIWGALFKILHLPYGNMLLSIGMGTEVLMFILTAFDRPAREYEWEKVYPQLDHDPAQGEDEPADAPMDEYAYTPEETSGDEDAVRPGVAGVVYVGGSAAGVPGGSPEATPGVPAQPTPATAATATLEYVDQLTSITEDLKRLHESTNALNTVSQTLLESYRAITENSENITRSSTGYVDQMASLSQNIQGLNTIYEIQLKSISSQLDSIDRVNRGIKDIRDMYEKSAEQSERYCRETEKMARYMEQLNSVYEKMITAMTINMYRPMMGQPGEGAAPAASDTANRDE